MIATVVDFRKTGRTGQYNQVLVVSRGVDSGQLACRLLGKRAVYTTPSGNTMKGKVTSLHGKNGLFRVRFAKGLPGNAIRKRIEILE